MKLSDRYDWVAHEDKDRMRWRHDSGCWFNEIAICTCGLLADVAHEPTQPPINLAELATHECRCKWLLNNGALVVG